MSAFMPLLLDVLAVVLVVSYIRRAWHKGFVRTVIQLAGFFVSLICANFFSKVAAEYTFEYFVREKLVAKVFEQVSSMGDTAGFLASMEQALQDVPQVLLNAMKYAGIADFSVPDPSESIGELARQLVDQTVGPTCMALLTTIFFLILFSLFMFFTRNLAKVFMGLRHVPLVGPVNSFLGGCVGAVEGVAYLYVIVTVVTLVLALVGDEFPYLTREMLEQTYLIRLLMGQSALGGVSDSLTEGFSLMSRSLQDLLHP